MTPPHHWWHQWPEWTNLRTQLNNPAQSKAKVHYKALVRWTKAPFQQNHATHFKFLPCNFTTLCIRVSHNITLCIVIEVFKSFQATFQILSWTLPDNQNSATMPFKLANLGARCPATIPGRIWLNSQNATRPNKQKSFHDRNFVPVTNSASIYDTFKHRGTAKVFELVLIHILHWDAKRW